jgi:PAS domain S-box-containing protein
MQKIKILVIDDEEIVLKTMRNILDEDEYHVETSSSAIDGIKKSSENHFDIIFLDLKMPDMNGLDVVKELKLIDMEASIIMITGYATVESATSAIRLSAYDYILKPIDPMQIRQAIKNVMKRKAIEAAIKKSIPEPRVLIVDGGQGHLMKVRDLLAMEGIQTFSASHSGVAYLHLNSDPSISTVLFDCENDEIKVLEFLEASKKVNPEIIFIPVTSMPQVNEAVALMKEGAFDYIIKPVDEREMLNLLRELWRSRNLVYVNKQLIYDLQKNNEKLQQSLDAIANIMGAINDSLIVTDAGYIIRIVNQACCDLLGYNTHELVGKPLASIFEEMGAGIDSLSIRGYVKNIEKNHVCRDGRTIPVLFSSQVARDDEGNVQGIVCVAKDISIRKKIEEQLTVSLKEKEIMLKEIHHRVKNNMQIISSLLNLQSRSCQDRAVEDFLKISQERIKSMALIHEKLYQSKDLINIDMNSYVRDLAEMLVRSYRYRRGEVKLTIDIPEIRLGISTAIPCGLIINELISNSLKHAFPGERSGEISVSMERVPESGIVLSIGDNGIGIPDHIELKSIDSLGLQLVTTLVEDQLEGSCSLSRQAGTQFTIGFGDPGQKE